jgi:hypothetical protein
MTQTPYPLVFNGKDYNRRVKAESDIIVRNMMSYLPSYYLSSIPSTNYAIEMQAFSKELAKIKVILDDISQDQIFINTRSEFLYQVIGYLIFANGELPSTTFNDIEFKNFLLAIITIYFQGSIPVSIKHGIELFSDREVIITEDYLEIENGSEGYDISDQFSFEIQFQIDGNSIPENFIDLDNNISLILDIIRPAHTLFKLRYIFSDDYESLTNITDESSFKLQNYTYDDIRTNWNGLYSVDRLGSKKESSIVGENVSYQF